MPKIGEWMQRRVEAIRPRRRHSPTAPGAQVETCRGRARSWVHAYAAGGAAFSFVPLPLPGSTTAGLVALEATMVHAIGKIYGQELSIKDAAAIVAGLEVSGGALKAIAREASVLVPAVGWLVRGAIAGVAIEAFGNALIALFERRHPGRLCASMATGSSTDQLHLAFDRPGA